MNAQLRKPCHTMACLRWLLVIFISALFSCKKSDKIQPATEFSFTGFSPAQGAPGATIVLKGTGFDANKQNNIVAFNDVNAEVVSVNQAKTELAVLVPENAVTGKITITIGSQRATSVTDFTVNPQAPVIASFSPGRGEENTPVEITGRNFKTGAKVYFGAIEVAEPTVVSATKIRVTVPAAAVTAKIRVVTADAESISEHYFYIRPTISSFSPLKAEEGDTIEVTGLNFSETTTSNLVKFGNAAAEVVSATSTVLRVKVPAGAADEKLSVTVAELEGRSAAVFRLLTTVTDFSPKAGEQGSAVTISGKNFDPDGVITLNGRTCSVTDRKPGSVTIVIPAGEEVTGGKITVGTKGEIKQTAGEFTVTNIWIKKNDGIAGGYNAQYGGHFVYKGKIYWGFGSTTHFKIYDISTQTWSTGPALPPEVVPFIRPAAHVIGDKVYIGFGVDQNDWWQYDVENNIWNKLTALPFATYHPASFVLQDKIYTGLGRLNRLYSYDQSSGNWAQVLGNGPAGAIYQSSFTINGEAYFGGGYAGNNHVTQFYKFNPGTAAITPIASVPVYTMYYGATVGPAFSVNNKGYVICQYYSMHEYDPATNSWVFKMNTPTILYTSVVNGHIMGWDGAGKIYEYIPNK